MVSSYTGNKDIEKPANGDYPNTWNVPVNADWDIIDKALGSAVSKTLSNLDVNLTRSEAQNQQIVLSGTLTGNVQLFVPLKRLSASEAVGGAWIVYNGTSGSFTVTMYTESPGGTGVVLPQGRRSFVYSDGTNMHFADDVRIESGNNAITVSGGTITLTVPVAVSNGGTGASTLTANNLLVGNGTSAVAFIAPGANGNVLTSTGTTWVSQAPSGGTGGTGTVTSVGLSGGTTGITVSGTNPITTSGTFTLGGILNPASGGTGAAGTLTGYIKAAGAGAMSASSTIPSSDITGLGTMATQAATSVSITGGTISGVTISGASTINTTSSITTSSSITATGNVFGAGHRAATGTGSNAGYYFSSGTSSFASVGGDGFLNFTTNSSIYSGGSGTNVTIATLGGTRVFVDNTKFEIFMADAYKPGGGSWLASSDSRLKKNVQDYTLSTEQILTLRPVTYQYNGQYGTKEDGKTYYGLIAQEVQATPFSSMVGTYNYEGTQLLNVDSSQLVYALLNAVKELNARVAALEAKLP